MPNIFSLNSCILSVGATGTGGRKCMESRIGQRKKGFEGGSAFLQLKMTAGIILFPVFTASLNAPS